MMNFLQGQKILPRTETSGELWISSKFFAYKQESINNFDINCICSIGTGPPERPSSKIIYQLLDLEDHEDIQKEQFLQVCIKAYRFINYYIERRKNVLVHCVLGMSRSAAICCFYLMIKENLQFGEAERRVKLSRKWIKINKGFTGALKQMSKKIESVREVLIKEDDKDKGKL